MTDTTRKEKHAEEGPAVSLRNLRFSWEGKVPLLDIQQFDVARTESLFLQGASGSGKSTLLGLLGGVLAPSSGVVQVLGQNLGSLTERERDRFRADHLGIIFQMFNLLPYLSILENTMLPCRVSARRMENARQEGGLENEAVRLLSALGLNEALWQKPVTTLSVGQQQRVAAARALIGKPELLIADEPTSALDTDLRETFIELLLGECVKSNATLVFVSHDKTLSDLFDRSLDLDQINSSRARGEI
jgi:putative ABC transport system ATP-binding protein